MIFTVYYLVVAGIANLVGGGTGSVLTAVLTSVLMLPVLPFTAGFQMALYAELRGREHPGTSTATLAAELAR